MNRCKYNDASVTLVYKGLLDGYVFSSVHFGIDIYSSSHPD